MGADMLIAYAVDRHGRTVEELEELISGLTVDDADRIFTDAEQAGYAELHDPVEDGEVLEYVQDRLRVAVEGVRGPRRDITVLEFGGETIWLTGGLSWGDDPTEMFMPLIYLEASGIF
jgi:hypothetical protein